MAPLNMFDELKALQRKRDLSPAGITRRLRQTSELQDLCRALGGRRLREKMRFRRFKGKGMPPQPHGSN